MALSTDPRRRMVRRQLAGRGIGDLRVLAAMETVPREAFLPDAMREFAYEDTPLPIEEGQTMSQPYIVARMADAAHIAPSDRVLEIGAGSGYAAAVLAELAQRVFTIERHRALASLARARLNQLGYRNVEVRAGEGTPGWPEQAPFDAIIATAAAPRIPDSLRAQLGVGGRLVMPVGEPGSSQILVRLTRTGPETFYREEIEEVRFVPPVGEKQDEPLETPLRRTRAGLPQLIRAAALPLPDLGDPGFGVAFDRYGERKLVLLGGSCHGMSEVHRARATITRHLIERHGFDYVGVEADWHDALSIDRHVQGLPSREGAGSPVRRFPAWEWGNTDVDAFVDWLNGHNQNVAPDRRAAVVGLDVYSSGESSAAVLAHLDNADPEAARIARERYGCLTPWQRDPAVYGRAVLSERYRECEPDVVAALTDRLCRRLEDAEPDGPPIVDAAGKARLLAAAGRHYRALYYGGAEGWILHSRHLFDTLERLLERRNRSAKVVVWAHNAHVGDARFTDMGRVRGEPSLGELCRRRFADQVALIGFGSHAGAIAAASDWDGPMKAVDLRPSHASSVEWQFHEAGLPRCVLHLDTPGELRRRLRAPRLERFLGPVYRPERELLSHYAEAELASQFDAFVWFDRSSAVVPPVEPPNLGPPNLRPPSR